jgi:hypothetical protein
VDASHPLVYELTAGIDRQPRRCGQGLKVTCSARGPGGHVARGGWTGRCCRWAGGFRKATAGPLTAGRARPLVYARSTATCYCALLICKRDGLSDHEKNEEKSLSGYHACLVHEPATSTSYAVAPKIDQYNCGYLSYDDQSKAHGVL